MADGDVPGEFTLAYEVRLDDLVDASKISRARKRRRTRGTVTLVIWALLALVVAAMQILAHSKVGQRLAPIPPWLDAAGILALMVVLLSSRLLWQLSPRRTAMRAWRKESAIRGRVQDVVNDDGVTCVLADGTRVYRPWSAVALVEETEHAIHLMGDRGRSVMTLPKRGLEDSSLVPVLRDFVRRSVDGQRTPPATKAETEESK